MRIKFVPEKGTWPEGKRALTDLGFFAIGEERDIPTSQHDKALKLIANGEFVRVDPAAALSAFTEGSATPVDSSTTKTDPAGDGAGDNDGETGTKEFACDACDKKYASQASLNQHVAKKHQ